MSASLEKRPPSVPGDAVFDEDSKTWRLGSADAGRLQIWHPCDLPIFDASFKQGRPHGTLRLKVIGAYDAYGTNHHAFCIGLIQQYGLPEGDDLSEIRAEFSEGLLAKAQFLLFMGKANEEELLCATFQEGRIERLRWQVSGSEKIFSHGGTVIARKDMKVPKPWPRSVELGFAKGKISSRTYFDASGAQIVVAPAAPKVSEWGQDTQPAALAGYITSGRFAHDVQAFFPGGKPARPGPEAARASDAFARLPQPHQATALRFDSIVKSGFPTLTRSSLSGYGFDCVRNELHAASDDKYFGLAYTADGDLQLLDLDTGKVHEWIHDGEPFEDGAVFPSLDAYAFAIVRIELAAQKRIPKSEVKTVFKRLGFEWSVKLI